METIREPTRRGGASFDRPEPLVFVDGLIKVHGGSSVLDGVSFTVEEGDLFGLLGTNGAGKTTTVEILQGLRDRSGGDVSVLGLDPQRDGERLRRRIGSQLQSASLPARMRVGEALRFFSTLHPTPRSLEELAFDWNLDALWHRSIEGLSGGERQRLFVALALIGHPRLVFLDELTQNLDPSARRMTWDVVRRIRDEGTTVILVTHDVEEAARLCNRIAILHHGRVLASGSPHAVAVGDDPTSTVTFTDTDLDVHTLSTIPGTRSVTRHGPQIVITGTGPLAAHVGARLVQLERPASDLRVDHPTLEDRFVELTAHPTREVPT